MYAVIIRTQSRFENRWPMKAEVSRDRPKTLFTKCKYGENCYYKDSIVYQIFETEAEADKLMDELDATCQIRRVRELIDEARSAENRAEKMLMEVIQAPTWVRRN